VNENTKKNNRPAAGGDVPNDRNAEETLVADARAGLTPSQLVEQKLIGMLKGGSLPVSHVQRRLKPGPR
jgi:hypothetical protein